MADFKTLEVWHKSRALVVSLYRVTARMRGARYSPLRNQIIRAGLSIPANIVEGKEQGSDPQFARYLRYAIGSTSELECHLIIAGDLGLLSPTETKALSGQVSEVRRMLMGLLGTVLQVPADGRKESKRIRDRS